MTTGTLLMAVTTGSKTDSESGTQDDQGALIDFLSSRDVPCPNCGYNLRGLQSEHCPECGLQLSLRVNLTEPKLVGFIMGLIGLCLSAGFSSLLLLICCFVLLTTPIAATTGWWEPFAYLGATALVSWAVIFLWVWYRSFLRRYNRETVWVLAASCYLLPLLNVILVLSLSL